MSQREEGTITVITIGFLMFLGLLSVVVINSSAAFLQRQQLDNLADGAALAAADALSREAFYQRGVGAEVAIDGRRARQLVAGYLAESGESVAVVRVSTDGDRVQIHIERRIDVPLSPPGWASSSMVVADATGQLRLGD